MMITNTGVTMVITKTRETLVITHTVEFFSSFLEMKRGLHI